MRTRIPQNLQQPGQTRIRPNQATRNRGTNRTPVVTFRPIAYDIKLQPKAFVQRHFIEKRTYSSHQTDVYYRQILGIYQSYLTWSGDTDIIPEGTTLDNFWTLVLAKIDKLVGNNQWVVHPYNGGKDYCIFEYSEYKEPIENGNCMPLEWVVRIKDQNVRWAVEKCISFIIQKCWLPICGLNIEDDYYSYAIDSLMNRGIDEGEEKEFVDQCTEYIKSYTEGSIKNYTVAINTQKVNWKQIDKAYDILEEHTEIWDWLKKGIQLASENMNIYKFMCNPYDPEEQDGRPIMFDNMVGFYWGTGDPIVAEVDEFLNANCNEAGVVSPFNSAIHAPNKSETIKYNDWPVRLYDWHTEGNKLIDKYEPILCTPCPKSLSYLNQPLSLASISRTKTSIQK